MVFLENSLCISSALSQRSNLPFGQGPFVGVLGVVGITELRTEFSKMGRSMAGMERVFA